MVKFQVDVVVCTANKNLDLTKGRASSVLLEAGGNCLQDECNLKYPEGIEHGEIAVVTGGNLSCKKVYFVALPFWSGNQTDRQVLLHLYSVSFLTPVSDSVIYIRCPASQLLNLF